jgi:hypothetical protein
MENNKLKTALIAALKAQGAVIAKNQLGLVWVNDCHVALNSRFLNYSPRPGLKVRVDGAYGTSVRTQSYELLDLADIPKVVSKVLARVSRVKEAQIQSDKAAADRRVEVKKTQELAQRFAAAGFDVTIARGSICFDQDKATELLALLEKS